MLTIVSVFGIKTFEIPGYEADDLIATLAVKFSKEKDIKVIILTGDLDTLQLVENGKILVRTFKKGVSETMLYDEEAVRERYGLRPPQLIDYKALVGDTSDNIKGVPGIGPKTAAELLQRFGTLENAYKNLAADSKLEKKLGQFRKEAELARSLVILNRGAPLEVKNIDELKIEENYSPIKTYFRKLGFETLLKRLEGGMEVHVPEPGKETPAPMVRRKRGEQGRIFPMPEVGSAVAQNAEKQEVIFIRDGEAYSAAYLSSKPKVGFDPKKRSKIYGGKAKI